MKRHYPAEFFCGLLNAQPMGFYSPRTLVNEARREGLGIRPPDVHFSGEGFTVEEDERAIRVGLSYAKHLSKAAMGSILDERKKRPFASVADLYARTEVEKDGLEGLIKGGFLDGLTTSGSREGLLAAARHLPKKRRSSRQNELPLPHPASWWERRLGLGDRASYLPPTAARRESMEWDALSLNIFRHPLSPYREALGKLRVTPSREILDLPHSARVRVAGLLESLQRPPTKSGRPVYFLMIEDEWGLLQATIFERVYALSGHLLHREGAFLLEGVVEQDVRRGFSFLVSRIGSLREALAGSTVPAPRVTPSSGAFLRAGRRSRRAG